MKTGETPASLAIKFAASFDGMMMVLSGMSNFEQMKDNLSTMKDFKLLAKKEFEAINRIRNVFNGMKFIPCTACRYCIEGCPKKISIPDLFATYNAKVQYHD